jgi:hypothetical protein
MRASDTAGLDAKRLRGRRVRAVPLLRLLAYYAALVVLGLVLLWLFPEARQAIAAPLTQADVGVTGRDSALRLSSEGAVGATGFGSGEGGRLFLAAIAGIGALLLALPVAGVHMFTRRLRYDPSLVQAIIVLPIVVAGVVMVVKNSLPLAFALAGIVAGVRFRQKLEEPEDAVYVLLSLGIGLAAGVQALDVALAVSLLFNLVVLVLWRYDVSALSGSQLLLATGDTSLIVARRAEDRRAVWERVAREADGMEMDGILIAHASNPEAAKNALEISLTPRAEDWRMLEPIEEDRGIRRIDVLVSLRKNEDPVDLLAELEERWSAYIAASEYVPHRVRSKAGAENE